jgi:hypothetical protein
MYKSIKKKLLFTFPNPYVRPALNVDVDDANAA